MSVPTPLTTGFDPFATPIPPPSPQGVLMAGQAAAPRVAGPSIMPTIGPAASSGLPYAATAPTARAGFLNALQSRTAGASPTWLTNKLATTSAPKGLGFRSLATGSLGRASVFAGAGQAGKMGFDAVVGERDGAWDNAAGTALAGAGFGAGIGSIVPGLGTGVGAAIGAAGGGLYGLIKGGDSNETTRQRAIDDQTKVLERLMTSSGVSIDSRDRVLQEFAIASEIADNKTEVRQVAEQIISALPAIQQADKQQRAIDRDARQRQSALVAAQAWLGPMMQNAVTRSSTFANDVTQSMLAQSNQISDPALRAAAQVRAKQVSLDNATQTAYMLQQTALTPQMYGYNTATDSAGVAQIDPTSVLNALPVGFDPNAAVGAAAPAQAGTSGDQLLAQIMGATPAN